VESGGIGAGHRATAKAQSDGGERRVRVGRPLTPAEFVPPGEEGGLADLAGAERGDGPLVSEKSPTVPPREAARDRIFAPLLLFSLRLNSSALKLRKLGLTRKSKPTGD
jgi:hypothetical protein